MAEEPRKTKSRGTPYPPGVSGNPGGRPRLKPEQKDALEAIRALAPSAAAEAKRLLKDEDVPPQVKVKVIEIVLDRTYGKPDSTVKIETPKAEQLDDIRAEIETIKAGMQND